MGWEIEVIPSEILAILSPSTSLITSSIGGGRGYSIFICGRHIGRFAGPFPRHSKQYTDLFSVRETMQSMRVKASGISLKMKNDGFPSEEYEVMSKIV